MKIGPLRVSIGYSQIMASPRFIKAPVQAFLATTNRDGYA